MGGSAIGEERQDIDRGAEDREAPARDGDVARAGAGAERGAGKTGTAGVRGTASASISAPAGAVITRMIQTRPADETARRRRSCRATTNSSGASRRGRPARGGGTRPPRWSPARGCRSCARDQLGWSDGPPQRHAEKERDGKLTETECCRPACPPSARRARAGFRKSLHRRNKQRQHDDDGDGVAGAPA